MKENQTYYKYWGKAEKNGDGSHLLPYHCLDVAAVGHVLLTQQPQILQNFTKSTGLDTMTCRHLLVLFLGLHDIGKFSETFQNLRPDLLEKLQGRKSNRTYSVRHDSLGNLLWSDYLWRSFAESISVRFPDFTDYAEYWQEIFGWVAKAYTGHHGSPPRLTGPNNLRLTASRYFSSDEVIAAEKFLSDFGKMLIGNSEPVTGMSSPIEIYESVQKASWLMAGFAVLCDWIGSNGNWFPFCDRPMPIDEYWQTRAVPQAELAIQKAGIVLARPRQSANLLSVLFPAIKEPTPLQRHVIECSVAGSPQLFILEDVTGSGKTEAAILLAQRLMAKGQGNGLYFALPTMATSNAMYERVATTYRMLFTDDSSPSLVLAHGIRHLSKSFLHSISGYDSSQQSYGNDDDTAVAQCASWLADNRKKALLADVGVGTIDQALLAILPSRFQSLRLFGLVGHILIVDEVHAYDPYMNKLLQTLLSFHAALGGSAILLSATLPMQVRQKLVVSFASGLGMASIPCVASNGYPLVTYLSRDGGCNETPVAAFPPRITIVAVKIVPESTEVECLIISAVEQGKCVCWVRNTVHDTLTALESLRTKISADRIMLFHARFAMGDRLDTETKAFTSFGKIGGEHERQGKILIATQVVEQSLDLDFDLLISDLAPMDLLIQRAGRLHRHLRDERGNLLPPDAEADQREAPVFVIHGPLPEDDAGGGWFKSAFPKAAFVYPSHGCLWLTARLLCQKGVLRMPDDARELIEATFSEEADKLIPVQLKKRDLEAEATWQAERSLASINTLKLEQGYEATPNQWLEDMRTPTRLGDTESTVRLARWDGTTLTPWYVDGDFPWDMSQVSLRSAFVHAEAEHSDPALRAEIERLKPQLPDKGKWSILVPLSSAADGVWHGEAVDKNGRTVVLSYNPAIGVTITQEEG
ncbi:MAG: CRISPR-associated helicase/endonuclease Cas3 [Deltaproteobacteria bacterium CG12_big_fil_rev_8_21_14_0_65_43_10]|nr:MAG: CRISPR-associated helicase/endonuclease Cas3 [Deltaproteobacteria bacterium CG12_big_fil_rev_8_21_14_0_65_43_10]PIZ20122.1 MAG: CRISPR-associated helicase/endonuclease Cas3 [Deltaproteobacteria bacterium CG_4_10_14_0_8_um_filter_43_12]HCX89031.1 CRISPR-associated helicase/endonuclease Cas3 [Deltaproteobacteria bacterium]